MIDAVKDYRISQLFDIETKIVYDIPRYQREYTWKKEQWEKMFDDIQENEAGYFLGSIICINQSGDPNDIQHLELVDGQQRMTTLSLLFAAIYQSLHGIETLDEDQRNELINLKRKLVLRNDQNQLRVTPQIQNNNLPDYKSVLIESGALSSPQEPLPNAGNRRIYKAYRYFQDRITKLLQNNSNITTSTFNLLQKVSMAVLVKIQVRTHSDAYTLFESLNNRGVPLSAIDLIKNKLLAKLERVDSEHSIDEHFATWNQLLTYLGDDYSIQERFFRQYYNAFKDTLKAGPNMTMATRSNLIAIYEKLIDREPITFLSDIKKAGKWYQFILMDNSIDILPTLRKPLMDLDRIQGAPSFILLLFLLINREQFALQESHLKNIIEGLVRFFVRRNVTDTPPTRDLTRIFMDITSSIKNLIGQEIVEKIYEKFIKISATDEDFRKSLSGSLYSENSTVVKFLLCSLEEDSMTRETQRDLWATEGKNNIWTIEHIFPQGENIPQTWVDMIANGDRELALNLQEQHVHQLGNLTITGYNSTLSNKSFVEKRDRTDIQGRTVGYKNGLRLNSELALKSQWTIDDITNRTTYLVDEIIRFFPVRTV